jgi:hypothetical protein
VTETFHDQGFQAQRVQRAGLAGLESDYTTRWLALRVWIRVIKFQLENLKTLLYLFPLLWIPVYADALHTALVRQTLQGRKPDRAEAAREALTAFLPLLGMKLYFFVATLLWSVIPIYGIIKDVRYRLYWAMASNVILLEGLSGSEGRKRCRELIESSSSGFALRTLFTLPSLLATAFLVLGAYSAMYSMNAFFWICLLLLLWLVIPASATANTFAYLNLVESEKREGMLGEQGRT